MNGYERIKAAMRRQQPDRIPIMEFFIHQRVIDGLCPGGDIFDLVEKLDLDAVCVGGRHLPRHEETSDRVLVNEWGVRFGRTAEAYAPIEGPIKTEADLARFEPPDPYHPDMVADLHKAVARFKGKRFILYHTRSDFMSAADVHGLTNLLTDFVLNPKLAHGVIKLINDYYCVAARRAIEEGADGISFGDDWAFNSGPMMSPKHFKEFVLPYFTRSVKTVKEAGGLVLKHSDGNLWPILDMIVDSGIDVINPIQPDSDMDIGEVKRKYGHRVCLAGNINCGYTLSEAPVSQVVREVKEAIRKAGPGGGYIMQSSNSLHSSVRPQNYKAMVDATRAFGKYPLDMAALA